jgi:hypothetical protein
MSASERRAQIKLDTLGKQRVELAQAAAASNVFTFRKSSECNREYVENKKVLNESERDRT